MMNEYDKQAADFLRKANAKMTISHVNDWYGGWKKSTMTRGWLYRVRIDRNHKTWSFNFSDSYNNMIQGKRPRKYDILACIEKYEPYGDVWDFASEFGYDIHDKESYLETEKIFKAVEREYKNVVRMFHDVLEELREIQ